MPTESRRSPGGSPSSPAQRPRLSMRVSTPPKLVPAVASRTAERPPRPRPRRPAFRTQPWCRNLAFGPPPTHGRDPKGDRGNGPAPLVDQPTAGGPARRHWLVHDPSEPQASACPEAPTKLPKVRPPPRAKTAGWSMFPPHRDGAPPAAPSTTSACPPNSLVALWTTTSAPRSRGRWSNGVAKVLSTTTSIPSSWAPPISAGRSATASMGLVGDSSHSKPPNTEPTRHARRPGRGFHHFRAGLQGRGRVGDVDGAEPQPTPAGHVSQEPPRPVVRIARDDHPARDRKALYHPPPWPPAQRRTPKPTRPPTRPAPLPALPKWGCRPGRRRADRLGEKSNSKRPKG